MCTVLTVRITVSSVCRVIDTNDTELTERRLFASTSP